MSQIGGFLAVAITHFYRHIARATWTPNKGLILGNYRLILFKTRWTGRAGKKSVMM
jgi:hypothetical protein